MSETAPEESEMFTLHGLRIGLEITETAESLEEAVNLAQCWIDTDDEIFHSCYANPRFITDPSGKVVMDERELLSRLT